MLLQDVHIFPGSVYDNIALGDTRLSPALVQRAAKAVQALEFIQALPRGFDTVLSGGGRELSQGQRQLIAFARVLAIDPRVLILDEATASIDPATEAAIQRALPRLISGRTCVIIAHRLQTVREASRIAVLSGGEIVDVGNHEQLMSRAGLYRKLYEAQSEGRLELA